MRHLSSVILSGNAEVAELADAPALGAGGRKAVGVRVPSSAPSLISYRELRSRNNEDLVRVDVHARFPYTLLSSYPARSSFPFPIFRTESRQSEEVGTVGRFSF